MVSASYPPATSGGADYVYQLSRRVAGRGIDVHVVTTAIDHVVSAPDVRLSPIMRDWSWREMPRLLTLLRDWQADVLDLHFQGQVYDDHPMITFLPSIAKQVLPALRVVTHIEWPSGVRVDRKRRRVRAIHRLLSHWVGRAGLDNAYGPLLRDSDAVIALSEGHRRLLGPHMPSGRGAPVLIPPPVLIDVQPEQAGSARREGRRLLNVGGDDFLLVYFGYVYPGKGLETLFHAIAQLAPEQPNLRLAVVGGINDLLLRQTNRPHYVDELRSLVRQLGIDDRVVWSGYYPAGSAYPSFCLRAADVCVLPYDAGVFLNNSSFIAAAAHGLPIVTTQAGALEPPLEDGHNLLACPPRDATALAAAVRRLDAPALRHRLRDGVLSMHSAWLSWDRVLERTIDVFEGRTPAPFAAAGDTGAR